MSEHLTYYPCPYVECNWWAAVETVMDGRAALVEHAREVHAATQQETP